MRRLRDRRRRCPLVRGRRGGPGQATSSDGSGVEPGRPSHPASPARQGCAAQIQVRQLVDGLATPENWLVSHTTPVLVVAGLGSGAAPE